MLFASLFSFLPFAELRSISQPRDWMGQPYTFYACFLLGMLFIGPFHAYLVDAFRRKQVYVCSFLSMLASMFCCVIFVDYAIPLMALAALCGLSFGLATMAGITLAIDVTPSTLRSTGNVRFAWSSLWGVVVGCGIGGLANFVSFIYFGKVGPLLVPAALTWIGIFFAAIIHVPFRAPLVTKVLSIDRFFLPRAWIPFVNILPIGFLVGIWAGDISWIIGLPIAILVGRSRFVREHPIRFAAIGLSLPAVVFLVGFALSFMGLDVRTFDPQEIASLYGYGSVRAWDWLSMRPASWNTIPVWAGIGLALPVFWLIFVKLSHHCQRGTANTTCLIAALIGVLAGMSMPRQFPEFRHYTRYVFDFLPAITAVVSLFALLFFLFVTYPYYKRYRVR